MESRLRASGGEGELGGAGGRRGNSPHHNGALINKTGATDTQADTQADTRQQFENIHGQLEVETLSKFNIDLFLFLCKIFL